MTAAAFANGPALWPAFDAATWSELTIWGVCLSAGAVTTRWLLRNYNDPAKDRAAGIGCLALVVFAVGVVGAASSSWFRKMKTESDQARERREAEEWRVEKPR